MEWVDHLQSIVSISLMLFLFCILIMLIHPKWRKKITEPKLYSKSTTTNNLGDLVELITLPLKLLFNLFKH